MIFRLINEAIITISVKNRLRIVSQNVPLWNAVVSLTFQIETLGVLHRGRKRSGAQNEEWAYSATLICISMIPGTGTILAVGGENTMGIK